MKTKRKAILTASLILVLCAALVVGATFALFGTSWNKDITVTTGNVSISAQFSNLTLYSLDGDQGQVEMKGEDGQVPTFGLGGTAALSDGDLTLTNIVAGDKVTVTLIITNTSDVAVKYALVAAPAENSGTIAGLVATMQKEGEEESVTIGDATAVPTWVELAASATVEVTVTVGLPVDAEQTPGAAQSCTYTFTVYAGQANASDTQLNTEFGLGTSAGEGAGEDAGN